MFNDICLNCFKHKGDFEICPHCGYIEGTKPEQDFHLYPGTVLDGRYLVGTVLGFGGFGITYKAWDIKLESVVAIKEFYPAGLVNRIPGETEVQVFDGEDKSNYSEYLERFLDEARNLAQFNGKANIVNVFGFFEENNTAYIVMEFLDGISLKNYIEQNGKMPADTAIVVMNDLLEGTREVHEKNIIHRDIAPDNIILTNEGMVKILDFGSARFSADNNEKTLSAFIKPGYAAPEQYAAQGEQGVWTDIYGLGATMYYMVTGIKPEESTDRMVNDNVKRPSELGVELPLEVDKSIMKAIALPIEMRFKSTDEFAASMLGEIPVEYPDVEIKKRKRKRNIIAAISALSVVAAVAIVFVIQQYYKEDIYDNIVPGEVSMWVYVDNNVYEPGNSNMPESFKNKVAEYKTGEYKRQKTAYANMAENYQAYMLENYGKEITLKLLVFDSLEGYRASLNDAAENDTLPDVFMLPDGYDKSIYEQCMDLTDTSVVIGSNCSYISSSNYDDLYPSKKSIPLGFNAPVVYASDSLIKDFNIYASDEDVKQEFKSLQDFKDLNSKAGGKFETSSSRGKEVTASIWGIDKSAYNELISLYGESITDNSISSKNTELIDSLKQSYTANKFNSAVAVENYFYYGQLAYLIGDTSIFEDVNNYMGGNYSVYPISSDDKYIVNLDTEIAVNKNVDDNKGIIARSVIEYLLNEDGQTYINTIIGASLPLNKNVFDDYCDNVNSNFTILSNYSNASVLGESAVLNKAIGADAYDKCYIGDEKAEKYTFDNGSTDKIKSE